MTDIAIEKPRLHTVEVTINGEQRSEAVEARLLLVHFLRETLGLTGTHIGCDTTSCGACTVLVDGVPLKSCTMFAVQAHGSEITTVEGLAAGRRPASDPGGLQRRARPPVRLLHAGDDAHVGGAARREPEPDRGGGPLGDLRADLPLHRLPEHRQGRAASRRDDEGGQLTWLRPRSVASATPSRARRTRASSAARATTSTTSSCPGMLYLELLRSPFAHARINSIDAVARRRSFRASWRS